MIIGRRGFITGLAALVAAPAIVRVDTIMRVSARHMPLYVPIDWLAERYGMLPEPLGGAQGQEEWLAVRAKGMELLGLSDLKAHAWPKPLGDSWININDHDPDYVRAWATQTQEDWGRGQSWWG